jgi:hypothetical protein
MFSGAWLCRAFNNTICSAPVWQFSQEFFYSDGHSQCPSGKNCCFFHGLGFIYRERHIDQLQYRGNTMFLHIIGSIKKMAACCTALAVFSAVSCASSLLKEGGWEGIRGATLRVYSTLDIPEDIGQGAVAGRMKELLLAAGKKRAMILLSAYIRENISDQDHADSCRGAIDGIVNTANLIDHECDEDSCAGIIDFQMNSCIDTLRGAPQDRSE